jgi:hypothetical protein
LKEGEIGGTSSMHWKDEKCIKNCLENLKGRDHSKDLGVDREIILAWILGKWVGRLLDPSGSG